MGVGAVTYQVDGEGVVHTLGTFSWHTDYSDFPSMVRVERLIDQHVRKIIQVEEEIVTTAAVEILRAKGYVVVEPIDLMLHPKDES